MLEYLVRPLPVHEQDCVTVQDLPVQCVKEWLCFFLFFFLLLLGLYVRARKEIVKSSRFAFVLPSTALQVVCVEFLTLHRLVPCCTRLSLSLLLLLFQERERESTYGTPCSFCPQACECLILNSLAAGLIVKRVIAQKCRIVLAVPVSV